MPPSHDEFRAAVARFFADPAARVGADELLARLPVEAPVLRVDGIWLISRYAEICRLLAGGGVRSAPFARGQVMPMSSAPTMATLLALMFPMMDGEDHRRLRGLSAATFAPRRINALAGQVSACVRQMWGEAARQESFDVVTEVTEVLPAAVAAIQMGTPVSERAAARRWAQVATRYHLNYALEPEEVAVAEAELAEFASYVAELCARRRRAPGDDLVSELTAAADAGRLSEDELVAYVLNMYMNGVDTLTAGLSVAVWELLGHPEDLARCASDRSFAQDAFEEAVRLHSPVRFASRFLNADLELQGEQLGRDDPVVLFYAAANRDPALYRDPDSFVPDRVERRHLGFGHGPHHCIGRQLSLLTGASVLVELARLPVRLAVDPATPTPRWGDELPFCTLRSLPVVVTGART